MAKKSTPESAQPPREALTKLHAWKALQTHHDETRDLHLRELFAKDPDRGERMIAEAEGIFLDYSKNRITEDTVKLLFGLAQESGLKSRIEAMFRGEKINFTEHRAVLHVARAPGAPRSSSTARSRAQGSRSARQDGRISDRVRSGAWKGHTGGKVRNIVNIGIGGSDLGPAMAYEALRITATARSRAGLSRTSTGPISPRPCIDLNPAETLFIVSSKTFTTLETLTNASPPRLAPGLAQRRKGRGQALCRGLNQRRGGSKFGIDTANMFEFWDWVGGRYSYDSAIGLSLMLAIGPDNFREMLAGFHADGRAFPLDSVREEPAGHPGAFGNLVQQLLRSADRRDSALRPLPRPAVVLFAAARHGINGKQLIAKAPRSITRPVRSSGARPARTASTPTIS